MVTRRRSGSVIAAVITVLLVLSLLGSALYSRYVIVDGDVSRLAQETAARLLADSVLQLIETQSALGKLSGSDRFDTYGGSGGYLIGAVLSPPHETPYRPALVVARAAGGRRELFLHVVENAPVIAGGPPVPGRTVLELIQDITGMVSNTEAGLTTPSARDALLLQADAAAKKAAAAKP